MAIVNSIRHFVADVKVVHREVQVPLVCPHCSHDLTTTEEDGELTMMVLGVDEVSEHGALQYTEGADEPDVTTFEADGADTLAYMDFQCGACRKSVIDAPGTMEQIHANGMVTN